MKKRKTIDEHAQLTTKIRDEYAKLQQENNQLKIELHKYKTYIEQLSQKSYQKPYVNYQKPIRKRKHYRDLNQKKKVTKVILILQKCVDVQENKKKKNNL